ncbi:hypothetical protein GLYMA_09G080850v4 [Glycine max]|nr:hypothetical protein GLYMA_09G080850v4 [Glycine max]KAH1042065.1 hypothetical protein GYH30_024401 [Glycine max]
MFLVLIHMPLLILEMKGKDGVIRRPLDVIENNADQYYSGLLFVIFKMVEHVAHQGLTGKKGFL